jgi:hypothetical protein
MSKPEKEAKQRLRWERMKGRGHLFHIAVNILIWLGSYALMRMILFQAGILRTSWPTSFEDAFFFGVLTGAIYGELDWSDMKRKFSSPPPEEEWTAK